MIAIDGLRKSYGSRPVLDGLSFSVKAGTVYGLLGPNGAGKTTTINILCNLIKAEAGSVTIDNRPLSAASRHRIGVAPQEISLYRDLTGEENLDFFARLYGLSAARRKERTAALIDMFQLREYARVPVNQLSGGWRRRFNIAVGLVHSPGVLILDEPTAGLDVESRYELWGLLENLLQAQVAILLTTHYLEEAERLCTRIGILDRGRIIAEGTPAELAGHLPAAQLAVIESPELPAVLQRAKALQLEWRDYGGKLTLLLPEHHSLKTVVDLFEGIPLSSLALREVGLEHVYVELTDKERQNRSGLPVQSQNA